MSYTIGYRMPMRDRPRVRVRLVTDLHDGPTEATRRAQERLAGMPDGTVVEALTVMTVNDSGRGGGTRVEPTPSETPVFAPVLAVVWNRRMCSAVSADDGAAVSPSGLAYPSEDGGMSFELPSNDAMSVVVLTDDEPPRSSLPSWAEDGEIASLPDGSVVECRWLHGGEVVGRKAYLMYGRELALLVGPGESSGSSGSGGAS